MKKNIKSLFALSLAVILAACTFSGCKKSGKKVSEVDTLVTKYAKEYPLKADGEKLTVWMPMSAKVSASGVSNYSELPISKELEKKTGVKIEYTQPSSANAGEQFNLMIASGKLPDIIFYDWSYYPGGADMAIKDGVIIPFNDMMDAGWAPNFTALMEKYPNIAKMAKTNDGLFFSTGTIAPERKLNTSAGPIIRVDWLEKFGLEMPETIDEWHSVLTAFKNNGVKIPLSISLEAIKSGAFIGAFKINYDFYQIDGKVKFGAAQPEYKEFLATMKKWRDEGLYDKNFSTTDSATIDANVINGTAGATWGSLGGGIGVYTNANRNALYGGAPYPTHKKGEKPMFGQLISSYNIKAGITTQCKNPELALKWLDYGYSEEGHILYNFGIEGKSFNWVEKNGEKYPQYTKLITANPDGLSMSQALTLYSQAGSGGNFCQDVRYLEQYAALPQQQEAWKKWTNTGAVDHYVPDTNVDKEYSDEYVSLLTAIRAYRDEMFVKFIMGTESLDNFDNYIASLDKMGVKKLTEIKQKTYDTYLAR